MDKKKIEIITLLILVAIGINYAIYAYFIQPQNEELIAVEQNYNNLLDEVSNLRLKSREIENIKKRVDEKLQSIGGDNTLKPADNQSLIRDFYAACKQYGISGDTLSISEEGAVLPLESTGAGGETENEELHSKFKKQLITFTFSGEKEKVENFIEKIRTITDRKFIITSIDITSMEQDGVSIFNTAETAAQSVSVQLKLLEIFVGN
ncbi:hypothetical protein [Clostridium thermarum]|uniref:hypothetical protein n=1 Tax=Clostridium thermarum TaxID=1716543 RepID=UPI0013D6DA44|nr:hypothetical protein [Clostridium thermarum]